jgi:probable F420-dependent oxidoreductase
MNGGSAVMKFGIFPPVVSGVAADPAWMSEFAVHSERSGFESLVVVEHTVVISDTASVYPYSRTGRMPLPDQCPIPDPLELLSFLAAKTEQIVLATGVLIISNHHPVELAKRVATLDALSGGRVRLCVGVGWMQEEIEACGVNFATRGRRADEAIDVMRALWADSGPEGASFEGEFFSFEHAHSFPKPHHEGVPIHIGGHSDAAARRAGRRGDGFQPLGLDAERLGEVSALMRRSAEEAGRDSDLIELTISGLLSRTNDDTVRSAEEAGVDRMVLQSSPTTDLDQALEEISVFATTMGLSSTW